MVFIPFIAPPPHDCPHRTIEIPLLSIVQIKSVPVYLHKHDLATYICVLSLLRSNVYQLPTPILSNICSTTSHTQNRSPHSHLFSSLPLPALCATPVCREPQSNTIRLYCKNFAKWTFVFDKTAKVRARIRCRVQGHCCIPISSLSSTHTQSPLVHVLLPTPSHIGGE